MGGADLDPVHPQEEGVVLQLLGHAPVTPQSLVHVSLQYKRLMMYGTEFFETKIGRKKNFVVLAKPTKSFSFFVHFSIDSRNFFGTEETSRVDTLSKFWTSGFDFFVSLS